MCQKAPHGSALVTLSEPAISVWYTGISRALRTESLDNCRVIIGDCAYGNNVRRITGNAETSGGYHKSGIPKAVRVGKQVDKDDILEN